MVNTRAVAGRGLGVDVIVDAATGLLAADGIDGFSMRKLGAALGVDPMAVYHHLPGKRAVVGAVVARLLRPITHVDRLLVWDVRVRTWASGYWEIATAQPYLVPLLIADPSLGGEATEIATEQLVVAMTDAGLVGADATHAAYLVVDFVHGASAAVAAGSTEAAGIDVGRAFTAGVELILDGVRWRVAHNTAGA
jgi:TetR/AcrR family tetracycline transcriptional repressor